MSVNHLLSGVKRLWWNKNKKNFQIFLLFDFIIFYNSRNCDGLSKVLP